MDELAMEYVLLVNEPKTPQNSDICWNILQEMLGRCGPDHTNTYLNKARSIYKMVMPST